MYAVRWNSVQEGAAARRALLDSWRQVVSFMIHLFKISFFGSLNIFQNTIINI